MAEIRKLAVDPVAQAERVKEQARRAAEATLRAEMAGTKVDDLTTLPQIRKALKLALIALEIADKSGVIR